MPGEFPPPFDNLTADQEDFLRMMRAEREGYQAVDDPLPNRLEEDVVADQPMGRTPLDDLRDGENI